MHRSWFSLQFLQCWQVLLAFSLVRTWFRKRNRPIAQHDTLFTMRRRRFHSKFSQSWQILFVFFSLVCTVFAPKSSNRTTGHVGYPATNMNSLAFPRIDDLSCARFDWIEQHFRKRNRPITLHHRCSPCLHSHFSKSRLVMRAFSFIRIRLSQTKSTNHSSSTLFTMLALTFSHSWPVICAFSFVRTRFSQTKSTNNTSSTLFTMLALTFFRKVDKSYVRFHWFV